MAKENKGRHYEMVLEDRQLLVVFFAVVLLCAVFFTLGFVLGRSQGASQKVSSAAEKGPAAQPTGPAASDLSFYQRVEGKQPPENLPPTPSATPAAETKPAEAPPSPTAPQRTAPPSSTPAAATSPIYLQVAAVTQEADAKRLEQELRKLGFPAVIRPPGADHFYRVQVGPFNNAELAAAAQQRLKAQGFRGIVKR